MFNLLVLELLKLHEFFASKSIYPIFSLPLIFADKNLWLFIRLDSFLKQQNFPLKNQLNFNQKTLNNSIKSTKTNNDIGTRLWELTEKWCCGQISNLDYLLKLNEFSGYFFFNIIPRQGRGRGGGCFLNVTL